MTTDRKLLITLQNDIIDILRQLNELESQLADMVSDEMSKREDEGCDPTPGMNFVVAEEAAPELDEARTHLQECIDTLDNYQRGLLDGTA